MTETKTKQENKKIASKAFDDLSDNEKEHLVAVVKRYFKEQLELQGKIKAEIERQQERLRIINLNIQNVKDGDFSKIQERIDASEAAQEIQNSINVSSPFIEGINLVMDMSPIPTNLLSGVYKTHHKTFYF